MNDNGTVTNYTPNGLNQLTAVTGMQSTYDQWLRNGVQGANLDS